jgi:NNP family nitrate/nitrite transporter-like MFS transporter
MQNDGAPGKAAKGAIPNLALATIAFAVCFSAWGMIAPLAPKLQDKLLLSDMQTSILIAIPVVLGSVLRIPAGMMTDRLGGRVMFGALLAYTAGAGILVGAANSYAMLLVAGLFLGVAGTSFAVGIPFVAQWFPKSRHGFALGVYGMGNIGTAVAAFLIPYLYTRQNQMTAGIGVAAMAAIGAAAWFMLARNAPLKEKPVPVRYREVLGFGLPMWRLSLFYFVTFGGFVAMAIFLPKLLKDWFDLSLTEAGLRAAGFTLVATAARPLGGLLADRFGGSRVLTVAFLGIGLDAIGLVWEASDPSIVPVTICCLTMAMFLGLGNGAVFKLVPQMFPNATGAVTGIVGAAGGLGGFFPPLVMGVVKQATGDYVLAFVFLVAFAWLCAGQAQMLSEKDSSGQLAAVA